jgi:hypothetical protein
MSGSLYTRTDICRIGYIRHAEYIFGRFAHRGNARIVADRWSRIGRGTGQYQRYVRR